MRVYVDESRRDDHALGVDDLLRFCLIQPLNGRDAISHDADIRYVTRAFLTIDDEAVADEEVEHLAPSFLAACCSDDVNAATIGNLMIALNSF